MSAVGATSEEPGTDIAIELFLLFLLMHKRRTLNPFSLCSGSLHSMQDSLHKHATRGA